RRRHAIRHCRLLPDPQWRLLHDRAMGGRGRQGDRRGHAAGRAGGFVGVRFDRFAAASGDGATEGGGNVNIGFPYRFDPTGRTAIVDSETHLRDLIAQVLFTAPGERVMRPDFGSGLLALTFEPNSVELAATTQFLVQGAL